MKIFVKAIVPALGVAAIATAALAQDELPAPVKARKAHMQLYGYNIGTLAGMARETTEYDAEAATTAAANIAALSALDISSYWVPGTDSDSLEGSRALPAIWDNLEDFSSKYQALQTAAASASETVGTGLDGVKAGVGSIGKACAGCHEDYQLPND
jgi:cytochrome c556